MRILNTQFSEKGLKEFEKLTRKEQITLIKEKNPLYLLNEIEKALKGVKYAKPEKPKKKISKSNESESPKRDGENSYSRSNDSSGKAE